MFWNPAGLSSSQGLESYGSFGSGGNFGPQRSALGLSLAVPGYGSFGLSAIDGRYPGSAGLHENTYTLGAAVQASRNLWIGTNQKIITADPGALTGWSMDAGLQGAVGKSFRVGVAMLDAASALTWGNGLDETQPGILQAGVAWSPFYGAWLAAQTDWIDRNGSGSSQWRAGIESAWFSRALILRGGATQASASTELFATAGLGSSLQFGSTRLGLDYAFISSTSPDALSGARHLASLSLSFGVKPQEEAQAAMSSILKDPRTGKIHRAKISLVADDDVREWKVEITDKQGKVIRTFKGRGAVPPSLNWDGKSDKGALMDADGLSYNLRTVSHSGHETQKRSLLAPPSKATAALGSIDDFGVAEDSFGLRSGGKAGSSRRPSRVKPALKGSSEFQVKGAEFDLSDVAGAPVSNWELRIVDDEGKVVKRFSGKGRPPKSLKWEGSSDLGSTVDVGLGASYVLRTEDESGKAREVGSDLVSPDDFSSIARSRPLPEKNSPVAESWCRKDGRGGYICEMPFDTGEAAMESDAWKAVREAVSVLDRHDYSVIEIKGYARRGEASEPTRLSQQRAENVLKAIIEGYELKPDSVFAKGYGESEAGRKVEVFMHNRQQAKE